MKTDALHFHTVTLSVFFKVCGWERLSTVCCLKGTHTSWLPPSIPSFPPSPTAEDTSRPTTLATTDIVVLVIYFLLVLAVGFWVSLLKSQNAQLYRDVSQWQSLYKKCLHASGSCSLCNITHIWAELYISKCVTDHIYGLTSCIWHIFITFAHSTVHVEDQEEHSGRILPCWQKHDVVAGEWVNLKPQTIFICIKKMKSVFRNIDNFDIIFISVTQTKYALYSVTTKTLLDKEMKSILRTIDINICHFFMTIAHNYSYFSNTKMYFSSPSCNSHAF